MFKTFIAGIILGIAGAAAALYAFPAVDQHRETSIIAVKPNGGNSERFHVSVPMDRIMLGASATERSVPPGMDWPADPAFADLNAELFKLRDARDTVIGVASRIAVRDATAGSVIEWVLHLPARGSVYVTIEPESLDGGARLGYLRHGTREFSALSGSMTERWVSAEDSDKGLGRIELETSFLGAPEADE